MNGKISNLAQLASIRRYTLTEGREQGLDVLDCDNGKLRFLVNISKACDVMQLYHEGQNMSFISKNGFTKRELPFLERFEGGMLYTCGLDSVGGREGFEIHGSLHNTPARLLRAEVSEAGLFIEAEIEKTGLFGQNLLFKRRITSAIGQESLRIEDTLCNRGHQSAEYCLLYHINVGYPMLDAGGTIVADVEQCTPRTAWSAEVAESVNEIGESVVGEEESCYFLKLRKPEITLQNSLIGKAFTLSYSAETLPCFVEWKSMAAGDYALGLEPCTTELDDRFAYRTIAPGEQIAFSVKLSVKKMPQ